MRFVRCDNCGKDQQEPYRVPYELAQRLHEEQPDRVLISLEHDEDAQSFDACSWACVAAIALRQSAESALTEINQEDTP